MLTARKKAFISHYLGKDSFGNASKSAILAGFSPKGVNRTASRLLKDVDIRNEIEAFEARNKEKYTKDGFIDTVWSEYETSEAKSDRIRALHLAGDALGYIGKQPDRPNQTLIINTDPITLSTPAKWDRLRALIDGA